MTGIDFEEWSPVDRDRMMVFIVWVLIAASTGFLLLGWMSLSWFCLGLSGGFSIARAITGSYRRNQK
jgi:hypothetical protein